MTKINWRKLATSALISSLLLSPAAITAQTIHTVSEGDTIYDLAINYGTTEAEIMAWNGLLHSDLSVGMNLIVQNPDGSWAGETETDYSQDVVQSTPADGSHIVGSGDTLSGIAAVYGVTVDELYAWNGLSNSFLQVGDIIAVGPQGASNVSQGPVYTEPTPEYTTPYYPPVETSGNYITIQPGDTLSGLAMVLGTTTEAIMGANGLSSDWLVAGQTLAVPADAIYPTASTSTYVPETTNSFTPNTTVADPVASPNGGTDHIVQAGDTLSGIATTYGVSLNDIYTWNPSISEQLSIGQAVTIQTAGPVSTEENMQVEDSDGTRSVVDLSRVPENVRPDTHVVQAGDNIWRIAEEYDVSANSIRMWNELPEGDDSLTIGDTIYVSNPAFVPEMHEVAEGETLDTIAETAEVTVENIVKWNELENEEAFEVGDILFVTNPRPLTHNVEPGETLEEIAENYNIEVADLRTWNYLPENAQIINGTLIVSDPKEDVISTNQNGESEETSETSEDASEEPSEESAETTSDEQ
ncbi:LysM peptidoglycan-binding domain-containing protein [Aerococcaceae bacterium DSM 111176]|nr:LysM peptidoglycan-binding domain-containing protein [Aerococcaceae bacterium DSM 111176]